jgi:hypothetical protein
MKNIALLLLPALGMLTACTTNEITPLAEFTFRNETVSTFAMGTYDTCSLFNTSRNAQSLRWDLGDGRSSTERNVILSYEKSGVYPVTLTITGRDGSISTTSKQVIVKDRVLRSINISTVQWIENENGWPNTDKATIWLQIQQYTDAALTDEYRCVDCPVIYASDVIENVHNNTLASIAIPVTEKIVIDKQMIRFAIPENLNNAYLISLMAKDEDGNEYCLQSNRGGGTYFGILKEDFTANEFIVQNGPFSDYQLMCDFE